MVLHKTAMVKRVMRAGRHSVSKKGDWVEVTFFVDSTTEVL